MRMALGMDAGPMLHQVEVEIGPDETSTELAFRLSEIGAQAMVESITRFGAERLVYVSCQPSSLVRDAGIICAQGYRLTKLGVMDMFPQTSHVESMAVFER